VPEFAPALTDSEQDLVDKMQATVDNAQEAAYQRRRWDPESQGLFENRLQAAVQASAMLDLSGQRHYSMPGIHVHLV